MTMGATDSRELFFHQDLINRVPANYRIELVRNSTGFLTDRGWEHTGILDGHKEATAIEIRSAQGRVMAAFGWKQHPKKDRKLVVTTGTWVSSSLRRRGLAQALWRAMIELTGCNRIETFTVSDEGWTLVRSMQEQLGKRIKIESYGDFSLEDLRTGQQKGRAA